MAEQSKDDILKTMRKRREIAQSALSESRTYELEDIKFLAGNSDNHWQWPDNIYTSRSAPNGQGTARPCLTINKLPQHVSQITNDQRQNRPSGKVIPVDDKGDIEVAKILDGIVRHIEYISDADVAYDTACESQVAMGEGYFRILTDYCDSESFDQDIKIGRIRNAFSVYLDPMIQDPCGADAEWGFIITEILKTEFEHSYKDASKLSSIESNNVGDQSLSQWLGAETVRIAEYFYIEHEPVKINLYPGNQSYPADSPEAKAYDEVGVKPLKTRDADKKVVKWIKTNGYEILEENTWPGQWIPIIRVVGNEYEIEGKIHISGLVRNAKDPSRLYNYWTSQEAEQLALASKAPYVGAKGQFAGFEAQWQTANTVNWPYLEYNIDVTDGLGAPMPAPQRSQPLQASSALLQAKAGANDDIKSVTGQYDASIGNQSNEKSGKAILARERQTDTGTYHYVDNLARAIRFGTRQIVHLIPKIYDTERIARIIGLDGEVSHAKIDPTQNEPIREVKDENGGIIDTIYNPTIGKYDVCVTTGPSYMTKRQETSEMMISLSQGNNDPTVSLLMKYFAIKNADFPDAQEFATVMKKMLPPGLMDDDKKVTPEAAQAKQQIEGMGAKIKELESMLEGFSSSVQVKELDLKQRELDIKAFDAETKRLASVSPGLTEEQVQDIVLGSVHGLITAGDLVGNAPNFDRGGFDPTQAGVPQEMPVPESLSTPPVDGEMPPDYEPDFEAVQGAK